MRLASSVAMLAVFLVAVLPASAGTVELEPAKDNTLYETPSGALSNGSGQHVFAGRNGVGNRRRAVMAFDIAGNIPAGAQITGVSLRMHMSKSISGSTAISLHRLLTDWGEGASDASGEEGKGIGAATGDATWVYTFFSSEFWPDFTFGGLFASSASGTTTVEDIGFYTWSSASLVDDVQFWLDDPSANFGWIAIGDESVATTAKRFDSRENASVESRPTLVIDFDEPAGAAPTCVIVCGGPSECEGPETTVTLAATATPEDVPLAWSWDGPCLVADPSSPFTSAECAGVGAYPLTLTVAFDENGNGTVDEDEPSSSCETVAIVQDTTAPELSLPDPTTLACAAGGASTAGIAATAQDRCGDVSLSTNLAQRLPLGAHSVAWKADDSSGNTAAAWTEVYVADPTPPAVSCSAVVTAVTAPPGNHGDDEDGVSGPATTFELIVEMRDDCCLGESSAVLDLGCTQLGVTDGQTIRLECVAGSAPACEVSTGKDGTLQVRSSTAILRGSAVDCAGNSGRCTAKLCDDASFALPPPPGVTPSAASRTPFPVPSRRGALRRR